MRSRSATASAPFRLLALATPLLLGLAGGKLWGYEGSILVTEGQGFCNSFQQYDTYSSGALVDSGDLAGVCVDMKAPLTVTTDSSSAGSAAAAVYEVWCTRIAAAVLRPPVIAVRDGVARVVLRRETEDDLLATDMGVEQ